MIFVIQKSADFTVELLFGTVIAHQENSDKFFRFDLFYPWTFAGLNLGKNVKKYNENCDIPCSRKNKHSITKSNFELTKQPDI